MDDVDAIDLTPRAIVSLSVPWSVYAVKASAELAKLSPTLEARGIRCFELDEEAEATRLWLKSKTVPEWLKGSEATGSGACLLVENGDVVAVLDASCLLRQTLIQKVAEQWFS